MDSDVDFISINLSNIQCLFVTVLNGSVYEHVCGRWRIRRTLTNSGLRKNWTYWLFLLQRCYQTLQNQYQQIFFFFTLIREKRTFSAVLLVKESVPAHSFHKIKCYKYLLLDANQQVITNTITKHRVSTWYAVHRESKKDI
jgi:hypothetical protein